MYFHMLSALLLAFAFPRHRGSFQGLAVDPNGPKNLGNLTITKVMDKDLLILPGDYENTSASGGWVAGDEKPIGVVNGSGGLYSRVMVDHKKHTARTTYELLKSFPLKDNEWIGTDNQVVRLTNGDLLIERDGMLTSFGSASKPSWGDTQESIQSKGVWSLQKGAHGAFMFYRITPNYGIPIEQKPLNLAEQEGGKYCHPRPMSDSGDADVTFDKQGKNPDGTPKYWPGGGDRTELYSCPFTGNLYLTTRVISGPTDKSDTMVDAGLVFGSADDGKTWKLLHTLPGWSPMVMTSTPDGRLWIAQEEYGGVTGQKTADGKDIGYCVPSVTYTRPTGRRVLPGGFNHQKLPESTFGRVEALTVEMELKQGTPSIARLLLKGNQSGVLISYQNKNAYGNQEIGVANATLTDGALKLTKVTQLSSNDADPPVQDPKGTLLSMYYGQTHSAMYGSFIQPELVGEDPSRYTDVTMLYWLDAPKSKSVNYPHYAARYAVFKHGKLVDRGYLSKHFKGNGTWDTRVDPGDYMKGASYVLDGGEVVFVPIWRQPDGLHTNIVTSQ